jgi:hypothetical protein
LREHFSSIASEIWPDKMVFVGSGLMREEVWEWSDEGGGMGVA